MPKRVVKIMPTAGVPKRLIDRTVDDAAVDVLLERDTVETELAGLILADPSLIVVLTEHSARGIDLIERADLRAIVAACRGTSDTETAQVAAWKAIKRAGYYDRTMPAFTRGMFWSGRSFVAFASEWPRCMGSVVATKTRTLSLIDERLTDAREAIAYARARLRGDV